MAGAADNTAIDIRSCLKAAVQESRVSFSRSSGPGGQNVNKSNTKATLCWNVVESAVEERLRAKLVRRLGLNKAGQFVVSSQTFRSQDLNLQQCRLKLQQALERALARRKRRVKTVVGSAQRQLRLKEKKHRSQVKDSRRRPESKD